MFVVGAIDFGTAYSGWAFSFKHEFEIEPTNVSTSHWLEGKVATEKAPTCVLIGPDGETLVAFGYEAENKYEELAANQKNADYYYIKEFKMELNKKLDQIFDRHMTVEDSLGRSLPAKTVFALTIGFLVKGMLAEMKTRIKGGITTTDIHWVLTVPAIWTDSAKQFMTEAAIEAGIAQNQLTIVLEPEAASVYCRYLHLQRTSQNDPGSAISEFPVGTKYMVVDAGGGMIDITVHEVEKTGGLVEVHAAGGGGWGGTLVNKAFDDFMRDLVTQDVYKIFVQNETEDWLDLCRDFELKKKTIIPSTESTEESKITIRLPVSLNNLMNTESKQDLKDRIKVCKLSSVLSLTNEKLRVEPSVMRNMFSYSVEKTISYLKTVLRHEKVTGITALLMVGGFSASPMLQHAVKSAFPDLQVIIPRDAVTVVLKGAVICGHVPDAIKGRVLKYTYGYKASVPFKEGVHPESNKIRNDLGIQCKDAFGVYVRRNDTVLLGQPPITKTLTPQYRNQTRITTQIYATQSRPPVVVDDSLTKIGEVTIDLEDHDGDINREIEFSMRFDKTVIGATARDKKTGKFVNATLNFLG